MRDVVVLWLEDDGTFEDQFGTEQEATIIRQQVVAEVVDKKIREGGYGQQVRTWTYEDPLGRRFRKTNDGVSYHQGRTYRMVGEDVEGTWKRAKKLDRKAPYIAPNGKNKVMIIDEDHKPGYEFYENSQTSFVKRA